MPEVPLVSRTRFAQLGLWSLLLAGGAAAQEEPSEETASYFQQNCTSCHTIGGGRLTGPDLTAAYGRLDGRKALGAWLASPPSAVMQPLFRDRPLEADEILALVAFLKAGAETGEVETPPKSLAFVLSAIGLAAALMVLFDVVWRSRFRAVRRPLVARS